MADAHGQSHPPMEAQILLGRRAREQPTVWRRTAVDLGIDVAHRSLPCHASFGVAVFWIVGTGISMAGEFRTALSAFMRTRDYRGRSDRPQFWFFVLMMIVAGQLLMIAGVVFTFAALAAGPSSDGPSGYFFVGPLVGYGLWLLAFGPPLAAVLVRRLHDTSRSGWWAAPLLLLLANGLGGMALIMMAFRSAQPPSDTALMLLFANNILYLGYLAIIIFFTAQDGTVGPNRYGPDPKGR
ncbi:DUF805 domain-containing protein [Sphingomonas sp. 1P06PA]|uniref:DUF805 domain-containing protein n=1 Tax=Sphingomonas sp. 1P06PA TaxID=554121 RepID=UPI0039A4070E